MPIEPNYVYRGTFYSPLLEFFLDEDETFKLWAAFSDALVHDA